MFEIAVLAILALIFAVGHVLSARKGDLASPMWPATRPELSKSEPAEEGAPVPEEEPRIPGAEQRKAA